MTENATIHGRTRTRIRRQWDSIQGKSNLVDFERAKLLNEVFTKLNEDSPSLAAFIVSELGEYPGKRTMKFVRMAQAFAVVDDRDIWGKLGGAAVVLLARLPKKRERNKVLKRVNKALERTGRDTVSTGAFRICAQEALGDDRYREILSERSSGGSGSLKAELAALKRFLLTLIGDNPEIKRRMPREVKDALGLTVARRRSA